MCKIIELHWEKVLSEDEAVTGSRQFMADYDCVLRPMFSKDDRSAWNTWVPDRAPYFWSHQIPDRRNNAGLYAYVGDIQNSGICLTAAVALFGKVMCGSSNKGWIFVAERARLDALFIPHIFPTDKIAGLMANYPDIPILEV